MAIVVGLFLSLLTLPICFVAYCRSKLKAAARVQFTEACLGILRLENGRLEAKHFWQLLAFVDLCPLAENDGTAVAAVRAYFGVLTLLERILPGSLTALRAGTNRERQSCSHLIAVVLDRRIAHARKMLAEQNIPPENQ